MFTKTIVVLILLMLAMPAMAQTPTPICEGGTNIGHLNFGGNCKSNTINADTKSDLYRAMATAASQVNGMPEQIQASGQNGQSVIPNTSGAIQMFGYIKWLLSPASIQELMGKTLAPLGVNVFVVFVITITMAGLYIAINMIVLIVRGVMWVYSWIIKLIELIPFIE